MSAACLQTQSISDRTRGGTCQTIVKAIRVVVVNKAAVNKAAARVTKAAAKVVAAKRAAESKATVKLEYEACDEFN